MSLEQKRALSHAISHEKLPVPTRRLEFVLYTRRVVVEPGADLGFEINLNTGPELETTATFDPAAEPRHWFLIDISICRDLGRALYGPPPSHVFMPVPHDVLLGAVRDSLRWFGDQEPSGINTVLAACRAWRYGVEGRWSSKDEAAPWAGRRYSDPELIRTALAARLSGTSALLDPGRVHQLLEHVTEILR